jgi:hypothetical protein
MGLLSIWEDWKKENQGQATDTGFSGMDYDTQSPSLNTAGGITNPSYQRKESPLIKKPIFSERYVPPGQGKVVINPDGTNKVLPNSFNLPKNMLDQGAQQAQANAGANVPKGAMPTDPITQGGTGVKLAEDQGFLSKLSGLAGVDMKQASANWKDKGGFEGLMSNPAFSLGLALMQSSANGKTINQGILDNFVKSAKISAEFKDRIEARKQEPIQATQADIGEMKDMLGRFKIAEPNIWEKGFSFLKGGDATADYDRAVESIAIEYQKRIANAQLNNKSNKPLVIDSTFKEKILKDMLDSKQFKEKKGWFGPFTSGTLEKKSEFRSNNREYGGPVESGKPYVVGEKGPEIIIPRSDGDVLTNDDSQIYAMLLSANPQLQKVSKERAQKIMRSRFPEYFEG